jgi:sugar O-acyltransferase (sialic acid O-acetyltransferase NeuD family)
MSDRPLVVIGAGGHGKVVADALMAAGERVAGFIDDAKPAGTNVLGLPVLGGTDWLHEHRPRVALGIGNNQARATAAEACDRAGCALVTVVHPRAVVAPSAVVEAGTVVMALAVVNADARIGRGVILNTSCIVEHDCVVGDFAHVSPGSAMGGGCRVGALAQLGIGATMRPYTAIGERSLVGAGAVVVAEIPADTVVKGVPARR